MSLTMRAAARTAVAAAAAPASLLTAGLLLATAAPAPAGAAGLEPAAAAAAAAHQPGSQSPGGPWPGGRFRVRPILDGQRLRHAFTPAGTGHARRTERLADPDDITVLGRHLYTAFQNGVGPQGQPSPDGNTESTIVEFTAAGRVIRQWDVHGKCDGLTADARRHLLIATVNEDAHSSIYTITPGARRRAQIRHYRYSRPLPHQGGTDAISIWRGRMLVSASAPGTTGKPAPQPGYPAVYSVTFHRARRIAAIAPMFSDEARAIVANAGRGYGRVVRLALTDPDSNEIVPRRARFAGDFMLTSQGDKEQIFVRPGGRPGRRLAVLRLSQSVDDTAWARSPAGRLYGSNTSGDTVDVVTGWFRPGAVYTAVTPCDANGAPATCPAPGFPPNYLGALNPWTGRITRVRLRGPAFGPQGLVFVSPGWAVTPG